jgi:hypothetical protein
MPLIRRDRPRRILKARHNLERTRPCYGHVYEHAALK